MSLLVIVLFLCRMPCTCHEKALCIQGHTRNIFAAWVVVRNWASDSTYKRHADCQTIGTQEGRKPKVGKFIPHSCILHPSAAPPLPQDLHFSLSARRTSLRTFLRPFGCLGS